MNLAVCFVLVLLWFGSASCNPLIKKKWYTAGSSLLSVRKATSGNNIRVEVELSVLPEVDFFWMLDNNIIKVDDINFGTSITRVKHGALYSINVPLSSEALYVTSTSPENVAVRYEIDLRADDASSTFSDPRSCQASINDVNSTFAEAFYRCTPDLHPDDYWYQDVGLYTKPDGDGLQYKYLQRDPNPYVNVTFERNSTANAMVIFGKEFVETTKTFLFISSILTINTNHIVRSITYNYLRDISPMKTDKEYGFLDYLPNPKPFEGELLTIYCEATGRNTPTVSVERNGRKIAEGDGISIRNSRTSEVSTSSVTFLHATKDVEGNYSCVGQGEVRKVFPLYQVELKPKILLNTVPEANVSETSVRLIVEGSKGVFVNCSSPDQEGDITLDKVERTTLSKWSERLNVEFQRPLEIPGPFGMQQIICMATDKNGETTFEHFFQT